MSRVDRQERGRVNENGNKEKVEGFTSFTNHTPLVSSKCFARTWFLSGVMREEKRDNYIKTKKRSKSHRRRFYSHDYCNDDTCIDDTAHLPVFLVP